MAAVRRSVRHFILLEVPSFLKFHALRSLNLEIYLRQGTPSEQKASLNSSCLYEKLNGFNLPHSANVLIVSQTVKTCTIKDFHEIIFSAVFCNVKILINVDDVVCNLVHVD